MSGRASNNPTRLAVVEGPEEARVRAWPELVRVVQLIQRRVVTVLNEHEVTLPQFDVLATLRFGEGVTQQELAERLLVTKGNVCGVLDRLERLGWVERRPDPNDRRANRLYLTPAGRRKVAAVLPAHDALIAAAFGGIAAGDVGALRRILAGLDASNSEAET